MTNIFIFLVIVIIIVALYKCCNYIEAMRTIRGEKTKYSVTSAKHKLVGYAKNNIKNNIRKPYRNIKTKLQKRLKKIYDEWL